MFEVEVDKLMAKAYDRLILEKNQALISQYEAKLENYQIAISKLSQILKDTDLHREDPIEQLEMVISDYQGRSTDFYTAEADFQDLVDS